MKFNSRPVLAVFASLLSFATTAHADGPVDASFFRARVAILVAQRTELQRNADWAWANAKRNQAEKGSRAELQDFLDLGTELETRKAKINDDIKKETTFLLGAPAPEASCRVAQAIALIADVQEAQSGESLLTARDTKIESLLELYARWDQLAEQDRKLNQQHRVNYDPIEYARQSAAIDQQWPALWEQEHSLRNEITELQRRIDIRARVSTPGGCRDEKLAKRAESTRQDSTRSVASPASEAAKPAKTRASRADLEF